MLANIYIIIANKNQKIAIITSKKSGLHKTLAVNDFAPRVFLKKKIVTKYSWTKA